VITKAEVRKALKTHDDAIKSMKSALLENNGDKVATFLEAANCAWELVEKLLAEKYPDFIELDDEEEEEEIDEEEIDEEEEEEEEPEE
jgi:hypothetical protein